MPALFPSTTHNHEGFHGGDRLCHQAVVGRGPAEVMLLKPRVQRAFLPVKVERDLIRPLSALSVGTAWEEGLEVATDVLRKPGPQVCIPILWTCRVRRNV